MIRPENMMIGSEALPRWCNIRGALASLKGRDYQDCHATERGPSMALLSRFLGGHVPTKSQTVIIIAARGRSRPFRQLNLIVKLCWSRRIPRRAADIAMDARHEKHA